MPRQKIENLLTTLHSHFGDDACSPQQQQLLESIEAHLHTWNEAEPVDPDFKDTLEMLLINIENSHPRAVGVIKEILDLLANMGI